LNKLRLHIYRFIWRNFANCREVTGLISREFDGEKISWRKKISMRLHIWACRPCQRYIVQIGFMRKVFRRPPFEEETSVTLSPEAKERLKSAVRSADLNN